MAREAASPTTIPSHDDIVAVVGDLDDATIAAIVHTGASQHEIETAARWASGEAVVPAERAPLSGAAAAVYDILVADPNFNPDDER